MPPPHHPSFFMSSTEAWDGTSRRCYEQPRRVRGCLWHWVRCVMHHPGFAFPPLSLQSCLILPTGIQTQHLLNIKALPPALLPRYMRRNVAVSWSHPNLQRTLFLKYKHLTKSPGEDTHLMSRCRNLQVGKFSSADGWAQCPPWLLILHFCVDEALDEFPSLSNFLSDTNVKHPQSVLVQ